MQPFLNNPNSAGNASQTPSWVAQAGLAPATPSGTGQPGFSQAAPTWVGQSGALPVGLEPTQLTRKASWPALRLIALWLKITAWVGGIVGLIVALAAGALAGQALQGQGAVAPLITVVLTVIAAIWFLLIYAYSELILVFLTIENNTRKDE